MNVARIINMHNLRMGSYVLRFVCSLLKDALSNSNYIGSKNLITVNKIKCVE